MKLKDMFLTKKERAELIKADKQKKRGEELIKDAFARIAVVMYRVPPNKMQPGFYGPAKGYILSEKLTHKQALKKWI
jgi:hypothetical protein